MPYKCHYQAEIPERKKIDMCNYNMTFYLSLRIKNNNQ